MKTPAARFTPDERSAVVDRIFVLARSDARVLSAAVIGSLAFESGDRWSDIDLTFGVVDAEVSAVIQDFTTRVLSEFDAVVLFDLPAGETIYRVFLLPGGLQVDLSFTPASSFRAGGPKFRLLFGEVGDPSTPTPLDAGEIFGWGVAYARDARACIDRGKPWMAELCVHNVRDNGLALACLSRGLPARFGRGYDQLPRDVLEAFEAALPRDLSPAELRRASEAAIEALLREAAFLGEIVEKAAPSVRAWLSE